jgi:hypothetical protein
MAMKQNLMEENCPDRKQLFGNETRFVWYFLIRSNINRARYTGSEERMRKHCEHKKTAEIDKKKNQYEGMV